MVTVPPPYSPFGISPANLKYSSGWSSTWTARWFFFGSGGMPLGTAHETPTPSFSSRKSQCSRRAWCSWTTNRGALVSLWGTLAPGSGVRLKSRLASYSASLRATMKRLGHGRFLLLNRQFRAPGTADENGSRRGKNEDRDRQQHGRVHGVDEGVGEDVMRDGLDLGRQLEACARLAGADLKTGMRGVAEAVDEGRPVLVRQPNRGRDGLLVEGEGKAVLQKRADGGGGDDATQLLDRVDHAGRYACQVRS